ncbi:MAG: hypothetical protein HY704_13810 [Gemmatimonadetes bacterium]|nr:hypothetical protein [Gemmatimonadota bacterium]
MRPRYVHRVAILVIVTAATGCDNVRWGGVDIRVVPPPARAGAAPDTAAPADSVALPTGPVLYAATLLPGQAVLRPVAELTGDSLRPLKTGPDAAAFAARFVQHEYGPGTEFVLFSHGTRVGTAVAHGTIDADSAACPRIPAVRGVTELAAAGRDGERLLALRKHAIAPPLPGDSPQPELDGAMRNAGWQLASTEIASRSAPEPRDWLRARADITPLALDDRTRAFAATYLYEDALTVGPPIGEGYSLFFLAENAGSGFAPTYVWFRRYLAGDKAAPRLWDHLDWSGDGRQEIVLEVYGSQNRWFAALARGPSGWRLVYEDPCTDDQRAEERLAPAAARRQDPGTIASPGARERDPPTITTTRTSYGAVEFVRPTPPDTKPQPAQSPARRRATARGPRSAPSDPALPAIRPELALPRGARVRDTIP